MYNTNVHSWQKVVGGVDNEIHNILKPREALPSQVFQVVLKVIKGQRAGKGNGDVLAKGWQRDGNVLAKGTFCFQTRAQRTHWKPKGHSALP